MSCLCIGPPNSGKTLLLKRLQNESVDSTHTTTPTVGTNIYNIQLPNNKSIEIRELGGSIAPIWSSYFSSSCTKILYVIDVSNLCRISASGVLLYTILTHPMCANWRVMIALTKMDVSYRQMRNEALLMLHFNRLKEEIKQNVCVVETSALTGLGINTILDWFMQK